MADEFYSGSKLWQYLAAGSATLGAFGLGNVLGWTSPAFPSIQKTGHDSDLGYLTKGQESLVASIVPIGALTSCLIMGWMIGRLGRKLTMLLMSLPFVLGWLLIAFAQNVPMLVIGRFITGFCGGAFSLAAPVYVGETAEASVRGLLGSGFQLMVVLGILFVFCFGAVLTWIWMSVLCAAIPLLFLASMFFMPESPRYYIIKGKRSQASESLRKLRGAKSTVEVEREIESIQESVDDAQRNQASFKDLLEPSILKPVCISLAFMLFQQLSGINAVLFFLNNIFQDSGSEMDSNLQSIIVGIVQVVATLGCSVLIDRAGRKILLILSGGFMCIALVMLGIFFYLKDDNNEVWKDIGWLPLISLILFVTAFSIGYGPIPWMMIGEILPPRALGPASTIATVFNWFLAFLVTQFYGNIKDGIGAAPSFWIFAGVCATGVAFVLLIVPETKGKSIDEIQRLFGAPPPSNNHFTPNNGAFGAQGKTNSAYEPPDEN